MSLPWFQFKTMDPIPSIARGAWESEPPEWVMRAEFAALLASGLAGGWSLRQLADRWSTGRKKARRVLVEWANDTADQAWPADLLDAAIKAHPWLEEPLRKRRVTTPVPTTPVQSSVVTATEEPAKDHEGTTEEPLTGARSLTETDSDPEAEDKTYSPPDPVQTLYEVWKARHPRARDKPRASDASKLRARLREDSSEDCALVVRWLHEAPDAAFWREGGHTGLTPIFKADKWGDRVGAATRWRDAGFPATTATNGKRHPRAGHDWMGMAQGNQDEPSPRRRRVDPEAFTDNDRSTG